MTDALDADTPLGELYERRVNNHQDLVVLVSDYHNRRGTGKTVLSLKLAKAMDRTDDGITTNKCTLSPRALTRAYVEEPTGSALVLDEAEAGVSKYEAASSVNKALRELVSMGRIEEKYLILNAPASAEIDRDLKALADVWITVLRKGEALIHFLRYNPYREEPMTPKEQVIEWTDIPRSADLRDVYQDLTETKRARLRGEDGTGYVEANQAEAEAEQRAEAVRQETRDELIREVYEQADVTQQELAESAGLSRSRVADILSGE